MNYNIGLTVNLELKRLLDVIPNGQRSEIIRQAIIAYAPQIEKMRVELEKLDEEKRIKLKRIQEERIIRQKQMRIYYEKLAKHEARLWLSNLKNSKIDFSI